jgi:hypothetical protein
MPINMQELKFKVLEYVRLRGPVIPVQVAKQIGSNILFAGAVLSELLSNGKIKISNAKIGGSPVYYFLGQELRLSVLYPYLHQRERHAYDLLKQHKVLMDKALEPVERVALREIKDFAYPIRFNEELFWRWYLTNEQEALNLIKESNKEEPKLVLEDLKEEAKVEEKPQIKIELKKEVIEPVKIEKKEKKLKKEVKEDFALMLKNYFDKKGIKIFEENVVKKGKEFDYIVEVSSQIGNIRMFLSAKDKKKINDADLSICHNKSQLKKLPLMILTNGELTKQAKEYINNNYLIYERI